MVNQQSKFSPNVAEITQRELLVKENVWLWGDQQQRLLNKVKEVLTASSVFALFDPSLETVLSADASLHCLAKADVRRIATCGLHLQGHDTN
jgi:hypothetical protein